MRAGLSKINFFMDETDRFLLNGIGTGRSWTILSMRRYQQRLEHFEPVDASDVLADLFDFRLEVEQRRIRILCCKDDAVFR